MDRQDKRRDFCLLALISFLLLTLLICSVFVVDHFAYTEAPEVQQERKTLLVDGYAFFPRQDIRVFLLMGIDRLGPVTDSGSYKNEGAADVILVFVFNETAEKYTILALNRDSMVEMPILGIGGKTAGRRFAQLALSHTYGNGLKQSCVNTRNTVSDLLYGATIHQYISMNMDAISILTDAVGGVSVNIKDDFSMIDRSLEKGPIVLNGEQAYKFLRTRKYVGDQLNLSRMDRHKEFMNGFVTSYRSNIGKDISKAMTLFEEIKPYVVTDCSDQALINFLDRFYEYELVDIISPTGTNVRGEKYMEFYIDEENLKQVILSLFYEPKST